MRQRYVKNHNELLENSDKYIEKPELLKGKWKQSNNKDTEMYDGLHIEIGMGKGQFISTNAKNNENIRYVGIEICKSVLALATKKIQGFEEENNICLKNLSIISTDAKELENVFEHGEVDKIYLNFSDPWPKKKHEKRRLTSDNFLEVYKNILKIGNMIELKTDNRKFFEYTILNINKHKDIEIKEIFLDLHKEDIYNINTEYEEKFCEKGQIYKLVFNFRNNI